MYVNSVGVNHDKFSIWQHCTFIFVNTSFCRSPYGHYPWKAGKVFKKENTCYMYMYFCRIVQRRKKGGTILQAKLWWAELYRYVKQYALKAGKVFQKERFVSCTYKKRNENTCYMYMYFCRIVQRGKWGGTPFYKINYDGLNYIVMLNNILHLTSWKKKTPNSKIYK